MKVTAGSPHSLVAGLVMLGLVVGLQAAVADEADQCPSGGQELSGSGTVDGVSFLASGSSLTMTNTTTSEMANVSWCAEGSGNLSNGSNSSGVNSTSIPGGASWSSSFDQDISRFVVYSVKHRSSGGIEPSPGNGNGGGGDGGGSDGGGSDGGDGGGSDGGGSDGGASNSGGASSGSSSGGSGGTPSTAGAPGGSGTFAPPPAAIPAQPTVTG